MEDVILVHILGHAREKKVSGNSQHSFTEDKLCLTNMIAFYDKITRSVNEMRAANIICLDFSKAFDSVFHNILEPKLGHYFLDG